jgi:hypothetical protein
MKPKGILMKINTMCKNLCRLIKNIKGCMHIMTSTLDIKRITRVLQTSCINEFGNLNEIKK